MCNYFSSSFGVANVLQRRAIVNGWVMDGKERPMLIVADTEIHNPYKYASVLFVVPLTHMRKSDMDIPIYIHNHDQITWLNADEPMSLSVNCKTELYKVDLSNEGFKLRGICPESAFQLALRAVDSYLHGTEESVKELKSDILKYSIRFMEEHDLDVIVWEEGKYKKYLHRDGTIDKNGSVSKIVHPRVMTPREIADITPDFNPPKELPQPQFSMNTPFDPLEKIDIVLKNGRFYISEQSNTILLSFMRDICKASRTEVAEKYKFNQANFIKKYEMCCYELINRGLGDFVIELPEVKKGRRKIHKGTTVVKK